MDGQVRNGKRNKLKRRLFVGLWTDKSGINKVWFPGIQRSFWGFCISCEQMVKKERKKNVLSLILPYSPSLTRGQKHFPVGVNNALCHFFYLLRAALPFSEKMTFNVQWEIKSVRGIVLKTTEVAYCEATTLVQPKQRANFRISCDNDTVCPKPQMNYVQS